MSFHFPDKTQDPADPYLNGVATCRATAQAAEAAVEMKRELLAAGHKPRAVSFEGRCEKTAFVAEKIGWA